MTFFTNIHFATIITMVSYNTIFTEIFITTISYYFENIFALLFVIY